MQTEFSYTIPHEASEHESVQVDDDGDMDVPRKPFSCDYQVAVIGGLYSPRSLINLLIPYGEREEYSIKKLVYRLCVCVDLHPTAMGTMYVVFLLLVLHVCPDVRAHYGHSHQSSGDTGM